MILHVRANHHTHMNRGIPGHKAKAKSVANCATLVAYLKTHGESPTSAVKRDTGLTNLNACHIFTFNDVLRDQRAPYRLMARPLGSQGQFHWSLRNR